MKTKKWFIKEDPIKQLIAKFYGAQEVAKRLFPTVESVSADISGLEKLIVCLKF